MAFTEHKHIAVKRQFYAIFQSPLGRDLGRALLEERGKDKGDVPAKINDLADVFVEVARELYLSDQPLQSR